MKAWRRVLEAAGRPESYALFFCGFFLLLNWPVLTDLEEASMATAYAYFVAVWLLMALVLFLTRHHVGCPPAEPHVR